MTMSFYEATVPTYLQTLAAVQGFLGKSLAHFKEKDIDPEEIVEARMYPDMLPFRFQIHSVVHHSLGAIEGFKSGVFRPPGEKPKHSYAELQAHVAEAHDTIGKLAPAEIDGLEGNDLVFEIRNAKIPFLVKNFFLSFSLPNFHFHATTAYDILRTKGVPLGKRDYMGAMRIKA
jgi:hypothetical protein